MYFWLFTGDGREFIIWFRSTWNTFAFVLGFLFLVLPLSKSSALPGLAALYVMVDTYWETQLVLKTPWKFLESSLPYPFEELISLILAFSGRPRWGQMIALGIEWIVSYVNILYQEQTCLHIPAYKPWCARFSSVLARGGPSRTPHNLEMKALKSAKFWRAKTNKNIYKPTSFPSNNLWWIVLDTFWKMEVIGYLYHNYGR